MGQNGQIATAGSRICTQSTTAIPVILFLWPECISQIHVSNSGSDFFHLYVDKQSATRLRRSTNVVRSRPLITGRTCQMLDLRTQMHETPDCDRMDRGMHR